MEGTHLLFTTLNKWLRANKLSLNFNKTNYVYFTTKRNMTVNLKRGFNNNFITKKKKKKFLGVTIDNILSSNNHIGLHVKKLSTACYIQWRPLIIIADNVINLLLLSKSVVPKHSI
jgi:hypothetical protein